VEEPASFSILHMSTHLEPPTAQLISGGSVYATVNYLFPSAVILHSWAGVTGSSWRGGTPAVSGRSLVGSAVHSVCRHGVWPA